MVTVNNDQFQKMIPHLHKKLFVPSEKNSQKNIKLQPVPPPMPSESLSVRFPGINSASNGIGGGTGCNFIFFFDKIQVHQPISGLCCLFYSYDSRKHIIKSGFLQLGHIAPSGRMVLVGLYEMIITFEQRV